MKRDFLIMLTARVVYVYPVVMFVKIKDMCTLIRGLVALN